MGGCETALYLQQLDKEITIVEMTDSLCADANMMLKMSIESHFSDRVRRLTNAECTGISDRGVHIAYKDGNTEILPADTVILAVGMQSTEEAVQSMLNCAFDVVPVGDCVRPGTVMEASRTAFYAALDI